MILNPSVGQEGETGDEKNVDHVLRPKIGGQLPDLGSGFCIDLGRSQLCRQFIQHTIDVFVSIGAAIGLGQFYGLVDHCSIRHFRVTDKFVGAHQQDGDLHGAELFEWPVEIRLDLFLQFRKIREDASQQN